MIFEKELLPPVHLSFVRATSSFLGPAFHHLPAFLLTIEGGRDLSTIPIDQSSRHTTLVADLCVADVTAV